MSQAADATVDHYQAEGADLEAMLARFDAAAAALGPPPLTAARLAVLDQFHAGGLAASTELARRAGVSAGMEVLDAGCGLGGPARGLAETFGCRVTGVDLTPSYVAIARRLTQHTALSDAARFVVGDLTHLDFPDGAFDLVWTQHVVMNIADRPRLYVELRRVLKPGGKLAFFDVLAADSALEPHYPTPWAVTAEASTLLTMDETQAVIAAAGFQVHSLDDITPLAGTWLAAQQPQAGQAFPAGPAMVMGPRMRDMVANFGRNIAEGRVRMVMGVYEAV